MTSGMSNSVQEQKLPGDSRADTPWQSLAVQLGRRQPEPQIMTKTKKKEKVTPKFSTQQFLQLSCKSFDGGTLPSHLIFVLICATDWRTARLTPNTGACAKMCHVEECNYVPSSLLRGQVDKLNLCRSKHHPQPKNIPPPLLAARLVQLNDFTILFKI